MTESNKKDSQIEIIAEIHNGTMKYGWDNDNLLGNFGFECPKCKAQNTGLFVDLASSEPEKRIVQCGNYETKFEVKKRIWLEEIKLGE